MCWTVCGSGWSSNRPRALTVAQMHEVLKSGGIDITERSLRTFLNKGVLPEERLPRPPGPWCRKKAKIRSEPNGVQ